MLVLYKSIQAIAEELWSWTRKQQQLTITATTVTTHVAVT